MRENSSFLAYLYWYEVMPIPDLNMICNSKNHVENVKDKKKHRIGTDKSVNIVFYIIRKYI